MDNHEDAFIDVEKIDKQEVAILLTQADFEQFGYLWDLQYGQPYRCCTICKAAPSAAQFQSGSRLITPWVHDTCMPNHRPQPEPSPFGEPAERFKR